MPQITNKIKLTALIGFVFGTSLLITSCSGEKKAEETEASADSTGVMDQKMAPDSMGTDSIPKVVDSSAIKRPEVRKTVH